MGKDLKYILAPKMHYNGDNKSLLLSTRTQSLQPALRVDNQALLLLFHRSNNSRALMTSHKLFAIFLTFFEGVSFVLGQWVFVLETPGS